jgi:hypothetical protein
MKTRASAALCDGGCSYACVTAAAAAAVCSTLQLPASNTPLPGLMPAPAGVWYAGLRTLNLRQNIIADATVINDCQCKGALEDLEVRDNLLTEVRLLRTVVLLISCFAYRRTAAAGAAQRMHPAYSCQALR